MNEYAPEVHDIWTAEFALMPGAPGKGDDPAEDDRSPGSPFDLLWSDGALTYVKEPCVEADTEPRFYLHIAPERATDLPEERRSSGFDNLDFDFSEHGVLQDGKCVASVELPDYPVLGISTGQFGGGWEGGNIWEAAFNGPRLDRIDRLERFQSAR